ncbi:Pentatricopeptide repeat-containing protein [Vitis vinifera]|uniref:Pentatricopeptide repeat-containing protein n=1 Tax=Vitis vinifera TaxID=29760 RepID=A0A438K6V8_VITVI|nr:Pentatricopeptide repeat-containing protein [Vitis vinifera]
MPMRRNVVCRTAMINVYGKDRDFVEMLSFFSEWLFRLMRSNSMRQQWCVYCLPVQLSVIMELEVRGCGEAIDMYSKCGDVENAWRIFGGVSCKKLPPWNGYVQRGLFEEAIDLYYLTKAVYEMSKQLRAKCDSCTVVVDIMADKHGLSPKLEHFACMVDLLGQARHVKEAYELAHNTIIPPYSIIWGTLLSAGCIHRNLEPANTISGTEGGRMRRQVKGKRIKRPFGCSWVEVDGAVHRFVIEDTTHMKSMRSSSMRQTMVEM